MRDRARMLNLRRQVAISGFVALAIGWSTVAADTPRLLSALDHQTYRAAFTASDTGRRGLAVSLAAKGHDPLPAKILRWLDMTRPGTHASFAELAAFIEANPNWPLRGSILRRAEESLVGDEPPDRCPKAVDVESTPPGLSCPSRQPLGSLVAGQPLRSTSGAKD